MKTKNYSKEQVIWDGFEVFNDKAMRDWYAEMKKANDWDWEDSEDEIFRLWSENVNDYWYEDEHASLNYHINGQIVCIADLGLWYGHRKGVRIIGDKLNDILTSEIDGNSYCKWYAKDYNVWGEESHHDGDNGYLYRIIPEEYNADEILCRYLDGKISEETLLRKYTRSLYPYVAEIYGWKYGRLPKGFWLSYVDAKGNWVPRKIDHAA